MVDDGTAYLPLIKGWYQIYAVTQIKYTLQVPETLYFDLKTVVADSFPNSSGGYTYVVHRYTRSHELDDWTMAGTWSVRRDNRQAVQYQGNIPYVVLAFPAELNRTWNGNQYNNEINPTTKKPEDTYTMEAVGGPYTVGDNTYPDCVVVNQEDNQEFIVFFDKRTDVYAREIGLIYKETYQLEYCNDGGSGCIGQQIVEQGLIYKQSLIEYGQE